MSRWRRTCICPARPGHSCQRSRRCRRQTPRGRQGTHTHTAERESPRILNWALTRTPRRTSEHVPCPDAVALQLRALFLGANISVHASVLHIEAVGIPRADAFQMHRRGHRSIRPGDTPNTPSSALAARPAAPSCSSGASSFIIILGLQDGQRHCCLPNAPTRSPLQHPRAIAV